MNNIHKFKKPLCTLVSANNGVKMNVTEPRYVLLIFDMKSILIL